MSKGVRVTCEDLETGESESKVITNDYMVTTVGDFFVAGVQAYANGTHVVTIKREQSPPAPDTPEEREGE